MIPSLLLIVALLATPAPAASPTPAVEATPSPTPPAADATLESYRVPMDALTERMIGVASRAVRFDWRRKSYGFGITAGELIELNNFSSIRSGATVRKPVGSMLGEVAVTWVRTKGGQAADQLAQTPYRQVGRPSRFEVDLNVAYPIAEGVATSRPKLFPATEFVFSLNASSNVTTASRGASACNSSQIARGESFLTRRPQVRQCNWARCGHTAFM